MGGRIVRQQRPSPPESSRKMRCLDGCGTVRSDATRLVRARGLRPSSQGSGAQGRGSLKRGGHRVRAGRAGRGRPGGAPARPGRKGLQEQLLDRSSGFGSFSHNARCATIGLPDSGRIPFNLGIRGGIGSSASHRAGHRSGAGARSQDATSGSSRLRSPSCSSNSSQGVERSIARLWTCLVDFERFALKGDARANRDQSSHSLACGSRP